MKKSSSKKDALFVILLLVTGIAALNLLPDSLPFHILGIVLIILGVYGAVLLFKKKRFIF